MPQFYVPARVRVEKLIGDPENPLMPHSEPLRTFHHYVHENQAQAYLNDQREQTPYYGTSRDAVQSGDTAPMTYGMQHTELRWPKVEAIYCVAVERPEKLELLQNEKYQEKSFGIGVSGRTTLDPATILSRHTTIYPDALHEKWEDSFEASLGQHLEDKHIAEQMVQRGEDLQRMYHILERSGEKEREALNLDDKDHLDIMKKLCVYDKRKALTGSLEDRTMTLVLRQIGEQVGVRTALEISAGRIEAEFAEQLNKTNPDAPAEERVAVAMSGTLNKFAAQVPQRDAVALTKISERIKGVVHNMAKEIGLQEQARDAQNSQFVNDLPDELRPAWAKVPEEEKDDFVEEFRRQRERAELDAAADKAVFMATVFALQRAANMASNMALVAAYDNVLEAMDDELLPDDKEFFTDEPDEIGDI